MKYFYLFLFMGIIVNQGMAQQSKKEQKSKPKKYIAVFDKLADDFTFKEVKYLRGKETEVEIDKPKVKYGDILIIRAINTNEFVFDMSVEKSYINSTGQSGLSQVLGGFTGLLGGAGGNLFSAASLLGEHLGYAKPGNISTAQNDENEAPAMPSKSDQLQMQFLESKHMISLYFESIQRDLNSLSSGVEIIKSETMTKTDMELAYNEFLNDFDLHKMLKNLNDVGGVMSDLETDILEFREQEFWDDENEKQYLDIQYSLEKISSLIDQQGITLHYLEELQEELKQMDFVIEHRFVIDEEVLSSDNSYQEFLITFSEKTDEIEDDSSDDFYYDDMESNDELTKMTRLTSFRVVGANLPIWTTGISFISPFSGINEFVIQDNNFYDSIIVTSTQGKRLMFSIGSSLTYEFAKDWSLIPNINTGIAFGILEDGNNKFSITLGGGVRLRDFPSLSINAGLALVENQKLKPEYVVNSWIPSSDVPFNDSYEPDLFKRGFSPGYFFGLSIHF